jgi:hypothetical protein
VYVTNADGTKQGEDGTFTTPSYPVLITAPAATPLIID